MGVFTASGISGDSLCASQVQGPRQRLQQGRRFQDRSCARAPLCVFPPGIRSSRVPRTLNEKVLALENTVLGRSACFFSILVPAHPLPSTLNVPFKQSCSSSCLESTPPWLLSPLPPFSTIQFTACSLRFSCNITASA